MEKSQLSQIQLEILKAIEEFSEKSMFTEAILAKRVRRNAKIDGKNKAGISLEDLEKAVECLESNNLFYIVKLNSANDILLEKSDLPQKLSDDARHRRLSSQKSMTILTNSDIGTLNKTKTKEKFATKRIKREKINIYSNFEDE